MAKMITTKVTCDVCDEEIEPSNIVEFTILRDGETTVSHVHSSPCLEEALDESEAMSNIVLHD